MADEELREKLAEYAHEAWSGWMRYMMDDVRSFQADTGVGSGKMLVLRTKWVERWHRQMNTPYHLLPEEEKESDRAEADKVLKIVQGDADLDWGRAISYLDMMERRYEEIGEVGGFALAITLAPLRDRIDRGERTQWLYDEIMGTS